MQVRVLGCSGGIGAGLRTSSLLINDDILVDCGTGVGDLSLAEMARLKHVFLTHSHLDHLACLPLLIDTLFEHFEVDPLVVHCEPDTFDVLDRHVFNWKVWPDFFRLPSRRAPVMRFSPVNPGVSVRAGGMDVLPIRVNHTVPGLGYRLADAHSVMAFSGDTTSQAGFWDVLNDNERLDLLIVECGFANRERELCHAAKHYCPSLLSEDLGQLRHRPMTGITHLKPGEEAAIFEELKTSLPDFDLYRLGSGDVFEL